MFPQFFSLVITGVARGIVIWLSHLGQAVRELRNLTAASVELPNRLIDRKHNDTQAVAECSHQIHSLSASV